MKTVTMSVRVSQADAEFIAGLEVPGASTPSDKLRAIITEARLRQAGGSDFASALARVEDLIGPARRKFRQAEHRYRLGSDMLATVFDRLPEVMATLMAAPGSPDDGPATRGGATDDAAGEKAGLVQWEAVLADRTFALIEAVIRLGMTRQCRCYDATVVADRLGPVLEMARLKERIEGPGGRGTEGRSAEQ